METITVATTRGFTLSEMEILVGSAIVIAALAMTVLSGLKHFRSRHQPRA
jgi:Tfp pilus assembly protein FimT